MTKLILIRHGQTESNIAKRIQGQSDSPLTPFGRKQMERAGARLAKVPLAVIYSSPLGRARQSSSILGQSTCIRTQQADPLKEIHFGDAEGSSWPEVGQNYPSIIDSWYHHDTAAKFPNGESRDEAMLRFFAFLDQLIIDHPEQTVAAVTHGGVLAALFAKILKIPNRQRPLCVIDNASFHCLEYRSERWKIKSWNDIAHLEGLSD